MTTELKQIEKILKDTKLKFETKKEGLTANYVAENNEIQIWASVFRTSYDQTPYYSISLYSKTERKTLIDLENIKKWWFDKNVTDFLEIEFNL